MSNFIFEYPFNLAKVNEDVLSDEQKQELDEFIVRSRHNQLNYLNKNLEIRAILRSFFEALTTKLPKDIPAFYREFFSQDKNVLNKKIQKLITEMKIEMSKDDDSVLKKTLSLSDILNNAIPLSKFNPNPIPRCKYEDLNNNTFYVHAGEFYMSDTSEEIIQEKLRFRMADKYDEEV